MRRNTRAGGFFLIAPILVGFGWGLMVGQPMLGVVAGTAIGIAFALTVWIADRRRG